MVQILVNGKKSAREFQNMAQATAFAAQNGDCINAEKLELAYAAKKSAPLTGTSGGQAGIPSGGTASVPVK